MARVPELIVRLCSWGSARTTGGPTSEQSLHRRSMNHPPWSVILSCVHDFRRTHFRPISLATPGAASFVPPVISSFYFPLSFHPIISSFYFPLLFHPFMSSFYFVLLFHPFIFLFSFILSFHPCMPSFISPFYAIILFHPFIYPFISRFHFSLLFHPFISSF